jgi:hypothetical protein
LSELQIHTLVDKLAQLLLEEVDAMYPLIERVVDLSRGVKH